MDESTGDVSPQKKGLLSRTMAEIHREQGQAGAQTGKDLLRRPSEAPTHETFTVNLARSLAQTAAFNADPKGIARKV